jgi:hypothetical protein
MFHSTSHQMMRELDTASPYRVQLKTATGYNMDKLTQNYDDEMRAHELEKQKLTDETRQAIASHALKLKKAEDHGKQLLAYEQQMALVKGAHEEHTAAEASHQESITAVTEKKKEAELAKQELHKQLKRLQNFKKTANNVVSTKKQNPSIMGGDAYTGSSRRSTSGVDASRRSTSAVDAYVYHIGFA